MPAGKPWLTVLFCKPNLPSTKCHCCDYNCESWIRHGVAAGIRAVHADHCSNVMSADRAQSILSASRISLFPFPEFQQKMQFEQPSWLFVAKRSSPGQTKEFALHSTDMFMEHDFHSFPLLLTLLFVHQYWILLT